MPIRMLRGFQTDERGMRGILIIEYPLTAVISFRTAVRNRICKAKTASRLSFAEDLTFL